MDPPPREPENIGELDADAGAVAGDGDGNGDGAADVGVDADVDDVIELDLFKIFGALAAVGCFGGAGDEDVDLGRTDDDDGTVACAGGVCAGGRGLFESLVNVVVVFLFGSLRVNISLNGDGAFGAASSSLELSPPLFIGS